MEKRAYAETTIFRLSLGILITLAGGLVAGTAYMVSLSNAQDLNRQELQEIKLKQSAIDAIQTDIAVVKNRLDSIDKKLDNIR